MVVAQLLGTNAAGKSTALKALASLDPDAKCVNGLTGLPGLGVVLIGGYLDWGNKTPGADRIRDKKSLLEALDAAVAQGQAAGYWALAWEGILLQTRAYHPEYLARGLAPAYGVLTLPDALAFDRIYGRSGKRRSDLSGNGKIITGRARSVARLSAWLTAQPGALVEQWDATQPPSELGKLVLALIQSRAAR